jgi:hypothetical protein
LQVTLLVVLEHEDNMHTEASNNKQ